MSAKIKISLAAAVLILAAVWQFAATWQPKTLPASQVQGAYLTATSTALRLVFFDVGQGDSALIKTPTGDDILVDGGPNNKVVEKLGRYLPPTDKKIEYVILSHPHGDHIAGLVEVLKRYEIGEVITTGVSHTAPDYKEFLRLISEKNISVKYLEKPQEEIIDGVMINYLTPASSLKDKQLSNLNNSSVVFKLVYGSTSAMFTGDFEQEEELVASSSASLKSDLLKVGHHGSTNANSQQFLNAVSPAYAVISVGAGNSYGHPHYRTIYYLEQLGAKIFRTDQSGDMQFYSDGRSIRPQ